MNRNLYLAISTVLIVMTIIGFTFVSSVARQSVASADDAKNVITVNGEGVIKAKPDMAYINLGVETKGKTAKEAQDSNADTMGKVIQALKGMGITENDIRTTNYNIYPEQYFDDKTNQSKISGYHVTNMVEVTVRDVDKVGSVIDATGNAGANIMYGVSFTISDNSAYYQQALQLAAKDARSKAEGIAKGLGVNLGTPLRIVEQSNSGGTVYNINQSQAMKAGGTPITSGELEIKAQITVDYSF
ncbi:SIMPL domain-containing protein [Calorimonas adulescens]|uniref:DUF541 domain-containing protein n=1 Tax=Calorimonas adulescens TaxID=2606906 RepID=A0A5D8QDN0_9THEO|nr:SIMPL domain-containing protein [Calorimonas adulescens]TZE82800.1 DUF541 domain-containing protein [Calorimonas adulescens]